MILLIDRARCKSFSLITSMKKKRNSALIDLAFAWLSELMFDVLIFVMTLYKTLSLPNGNGIGLLSMLMRDGK